MRSAQINEAQASLPHDDHGFFVATSEQQSIPRFDQLYLKYYRQLCVVSYAKVRCQAAAEEIVDDVFMSIWTKREQLQIDGSVSYYLRRSVVNKSIDYLRSLQRRRQHELATDMIPQIASTEANDHLVEDEIQVILDNILEKLPSKGRQIFLLSREEGYSYKEIADQLQISVRTVETHIRRALTTIKHLLSQSSVEVVLK